MHGETVKSLLVINSCISIAREMHNIKEDSSVGQQNFLDVNQNLTVKKDNKAVHIATGFEASKTRLCIQRLCSLPHGC
jgi:hypothetical protein